mgnify:CR=1 FL=1
MKLDLTGIHIEVTDAIKEFTEKKVKKLDKFFDENTICHVTFTDKSKGKQRLDIRIEYKSRTYLAETETDNLYTGIEVLISKIEGQIRKDKTIAEKSRKEGLPEIESVEDEEE